MAEKFRIRYRRARVTVSGTKPLKCAACGAKGRVELHHYLYAYTTAQVRSDPQLALDNTIELCYQCHRLADALRKLFSDTVRSEAVIRAVVSKIRGDANVKTSM